MLGGSSSCKEARGILGNYGNLRVSLVNTYKDICSSRRSITDVARASERERRGENEKEEESGLLSSLSFHFSDRSFEGFFH